MIDEIAKLNWTKRWSSPLRLFGCSYWGEQYIVANKNVHGDGFHHILFTHQNGISNCYRVQEETNNFGKFLAQKATNNPELLSKWSIDLKNYAVQLRSLFKNFPDTFFRLNFFEDFEKIHNAYTPMAVANNVVVEYLPEFLINEYGKILSESRTYTESVYNEMDQLFRQLTKLLAEKEEYNPLYLSDLLHDEFKKYLTDRVLPSRQEMEERYAWSGLYFAEGKRYILDGHQVIELERMIFEKQGGIRSEVTGKVASSGKVKGICRIIPHPDRVLEFNDGDILITGMTRPNFVPLMKRAGAIVTDAGGLLCHAAIVSRELGKPCVIATEIATKVFKDGDMVEVDAEKGIVRKI